MLLTFDDVAKELACSKSLVEQLAARRDLPVRRLGRAVRVDRRDLQKFVDHLPRERSSK